MLERADRMVVAVHDRKNAVETFRAMFGAEVAREDVSPEWAALRTVMAVGESELELLEPDGSGRTKTHLETRGEGLMAAGYCTADPAALAARWRELDVGFQKVGEQLLLDPAETPGFPMVISASADRSRVGPVSHFYEATNAIAGDWKEAAATYTRLFDLDPSKFSPIGSERFGYVGTLTLFDPPNRLDRIEISQVLDEKHPMGRYVRDHGDCLYMCYVEAHDIVGLRDRMLSHGARLTPRSRDIMEERNGFWVHPSSLHGMLLGVARTDYAWGWSGHQELVPPFKTWSNQT